MEKKKIKIGIISGKGGVGKTSLTASLSSLAIQDEDIRIIAADCDVDAPNLAIILPPRSEKDVKIQDVYTTLKATFLEEKCLNCKKCIEEHFCEFKALKWDQKNKIPIVNYLACEGCNACKVLCPEHAFDIKAVKSGEIINYLSFEDLPLVYGKTRLGSTTSGKLVSEIKEYISKLDEFSKSNLIIIDGPPGIGCPVIATVSGLDYIITITEPTPSGLHDLIRTIELINQFKIPFGIVVNKADLKSSFQEEFANFMNKTDYNILGKIPFDLSIPRSMSYAKPVVDYDSNSSASVAITKIYKELKNTFIVS